MAVSQACYRKERWWWLPIEHFWKMHAHSICNNAQDKLDIAAKTELADVEQSDRPCLPKSWGWVFTLPRVACHDVMQTETWLDLWVTQWPTIPWMKRHQWTCNLRAKFNIPDSVIHYGKHRIRMKAAFWQTCQCRTYWHTHLGTCNFESCSILASLNIPDSMTLHWGFEMSCLQCSRLDPRIVSMIEFVNHWVRNWSSLPKNCNSQRQAPRMPLPQLHWAMLPRISLSGPYAPCRDETSWGRFAS